MSVYYEDIHKIASDFLLSLLAYNGIAAKAQPIKAMPI
jgi:hypothetical protein